MLVPTQALNGLNSETTSAEVISAQLSRVKLFSRVAADAQQRVSQRLSSAYNREALALELSSTVGESRSLTVGFY